MFLIFFFSTRVVFFKALHVREQVESDRGKWLDNVYPYVGVSVDGGDRSEVDSSERFYAK